MLYRVAGEPLDHTDFHLRPITFNMKTILCLCVVVAAAAAMPQDLRTLPVIQRTEIRDEAGQISESYSTHDGQHFSERGILKRTPDGLDNVLVKTGSFQFISPEGLPFQVTWEADEGGFRAHGKHLPVQAPAPAPAPAPAFF